MKRTITMTVDTYATRLGEVVSATMIPLKCQPPMPNGQSGSTVAALSIGGDWLILWAQGGDFDGVSENDMDDPEMLADWQSELIREAVGELRAVLTGNGKDPDACAEDLDWWENLADKIDRSIELAANNG